MQEQSQQTLLPGPKLSYDHPHFIPLSLFHITHHNAKQLPLHFAAGAVQLVKKVL